MDLLRRALFASPLSLLLLACGKLAATSDAPGSGSRDDGGTSAAASLGDAGIDGADDAAGAVSTYPVGLISMSRKLFDAYFFQPTPLPPECATVTAGSCSSTACDLPGPPLPPQIYESAGRLLVTTTQIQLPIDPGSNGAYWQVFDVDAGTAAWSVHSAISVQAEGKVVPRFSVVSSAPDPVTITTPLPRDASGAFILHRGAPFDLAWSPVNAQYVAAYIDVRGAGTAASLDCAFDAKALSGTIPPEILATLGTDARGALSVTSRNVGLTTAGPYRTTLVASEPALDSNGAEVYSDVYVP